MATSIQPTSFDDHLNDSSSTDDEEANARRDKDIRERDEFAKRLRQRDDEQTKKKLKHEPLSRDSDHSKLPVEELRKNSRRSYLVRREEQKLGELEADIADEEYLFKDTALTKRERDIIKFKKHTLSLAREHERAQKMENIDRYHIPSGKSDETSKYDRYREDNRYSDAKTSGQPGQYSEQRKWEDEVIQTALLHFGSRDKEEKSKQTKYDYILDEEIQFIQQLTIPGVNEFLQQKEKSRSDEHEDENKRKHRSLQEARKTLPIYRFRQDLMNAIRDHQVLIIEGETGSGKTSKNLFKSMLNFSDEILC